VTHRAPAGRRLDVDALARVEGEGALHVALDGDRVTDVQLEIFEPPRFFEAFLRGRRHTEPPDITARICGICPVAYQMSACLAVEDACGVEVEAPVAELRRLLYCGEWIESHALHIHLLHAPDFLGYEGAVDLAADHRAEVERGLEVKKIGNEVLSFLGGRAIHPVNVRVGGFYRVPARRDLRPLRDRLERGLELAVEVVDWVAGFEFPDLRIDHPLVALSDPDRYAVLDGRVRTDAGLELDGAEFGDLLTEHHVAHSTALHARLGDDDHHLVGPLARFALNFDQLAPEARAAAQGAGVGPDCRNPFQTIVVRAVEVVHAFAEALRVVDAYEPPDRPAVDVPPRAATGHGCTEAPRGLLYHRYELDDDGVITDAVIVPPTSQNQATIEHDLVDVIQGSAHLPDVELQHVAEQAIRNYDPCISCATHFLDLTVERR